MGRGGEGGEAWGVGGQRRERWTPGPGGWAEQRRAGAGWARCGGWWTGGVGAAVAERARGAGGAVG